MRRKKKKKRNEKNFFFFFSPRSHDLGIPESRGKLCIIFIVQQLNTQLVFLLNQLEYNMITKWFRVQLGPMEIQTRVNFFPQNSYYGLNKAYFFIFSNKNSRPFRMHTTKQGKTSFDGAHFFLGGGRGYIEKAKTVFKNTKGVVKN